MKLHIMVLWAVVCSLALGCEAEPASLAARAPAQGKEIIRRRAVLVGINDYSAARFPAPAAPIPQRDWPDLYGAVNDVEAMQEMLVKLYGFDARDIVVLKNHEATRAAILNALEQHLERRSARGDVAFFYFAGHGSQVPNSRSTEPDKLDESLVPADSRAGAHDIRDKELRRRLIRILDRGARLTVLLDNCHSGSGARGLQTGGRLRAVRRDSRDAADAADAGPPPEDRGALIISAAQDYDTARETRDDRGFARGVFSSAWLRAMRAAPGERAIDTFLRAQAILRGETPFQEPVLAGSPAARNAPFLGTDASVHEAKTRIAIEKVRDDGTVLLQGGWAHGLTVGTELRLADGTSPLRLEVTALLGLSRCESRVVNANRSVAPEVPAGALLEVAAWAAPPSRPLRVWMPQVSDGDGVVAWTREVAKLAKTRGITWISDPTRMTPAFLLRWNRGVWELLGRSGLIARLSPNATPQEAIARIAEGTSLFVQLPAPAKLVETIDVGPGTDRAAIEPVTSPEEADYVLAGRFSNGKAEYAWVRPSVTKRDQPRTALPLRTAWQNAAAIARAGARLQSLVVRLRRVQGWQQLQAPPGSESPYSLLVQRSSDGSFARGTLTGGEHYALALKPRIAPLPMRFVYVFVIDSDGRGVLLFPLNGSVENRLPYAVTGPQIPLDASFDVTAPYGTDTYFLLTTDEPLPDPWILTWDGVRGGGAPATPLGELLVSVGSTSRSVQPVRTPANWSLERVLLNSVPPRR